MIQVRVEILRRQGIADPEGSTVARALRDLGYDEVGTVHFGREIVLDLDTDDPVRAGTRVEEMCERLLANPVIEDYVVTVLDPEMEAR